MDGSSVTWVEIPVTVFPETETFGRNIPRFKEAAKRSGVGTGGASRKLLTGRTLSTSIIGQQMDAEADGLISLGTAARRYICSPGRGKE